ncbi:MAG: efflux RND transporter periplasmic adaptor subunit [Campylobacterota bacterium]|nr:efflux RND transporter periplasmic adaptor subunit [Campylobacterota bacterium]
MKILISVLAFGILLFASQVIEVSKKQQDDLGVKTQKIASVSTVSFGPYNGIVVLDKRDIISIGSNVDSVVKNIYVRKLEHVKKGQKLLTLVSNELLSIQQKYIQALIESENIDKHYLRNQKLQANGIVSYKKLLDSLQDKQSADLRVRLSANELLASGFSKAMLKRVQNSHQPIMQINIIAPRDALINKIDVNIGEKVESNRSMMSIYASGKRFIELSVPLKAAEMISIGDRCEFSSYSAKITTIGNIVNSTSQSVQVRAEIDNAKNIMINRVYRVDIYKNSRDSLKIKKSALVYKEGIAYVFKKITTGFEVINVEIIDEDSSDYIIKADLKEGDELAVSSTSALLSATDSLDE